MTNANPELSSAPLGFIMMRQHEKAAYEAMTIEQKGYFIHWIRSNPWNQRSWGKMIKRAKGQRP